ncbi:MAG: endonuclease III [Desulfobacterales bacterium]|nr:endonuclease III [Desulfobacterales bacterium]
MLDSQIDECIQIWKKHYPTWKAPILELLSKRGKTPFEILIATILSLRTKDEVTAKSAERLFSHANTVDEMQQLDINKIEELIYPVGFYHTKATRIKQITEILIEKYDKKVPDTLDALLEFPGIGRKTANLVLSECFGKDAICVDTHVHKISNRLGWVQTKNPKQTEFALIQKLPKIYWNDINELMVAFGQTLCKPISPWCGQCPIEHYCPKIGVTKHR